MFTSQVDTPTTMATLFFLIATCAALLATTGLAFVDSGLSSRGNMLDAWLGKLAAGLSTAFGFVFIGYGIWQWQFNQAFGIPNPLGQAIKDWWIGGHALTALPQSLNPTVVATANEQQIFFGFFVTFAFFVGAFLHSGSMGRLRPVPLIAMCLFVGAILYPVLSYLTWGPTGPLTNNGLHDFEGVFMLYIFGGAFALTLAKLKGPRPGAFSADPEYRPQNISHVAIGVLLLMIALPLIAVGSGYFVPNVGYFGISMTSTGVAQVAIGVLVAFMAGGFSGLIITRMTDNPAWMLFGPIAAFVANGTLFDVVTLWKVMMVAFVAPLVSYGAYRLLVRARIDELKVVPIALAPGIFGVIVGGLLAANVKTGGYFGLKGPYGFQHAHITLGYQLLGVLVALAFGIFTAALAMVLSRGKREAPGAAGASLDTAHWKLGSPDVSGASQEA